MVDQTKHGFGLKLNNKDLLARVERIDNEYELSADVDYPLFIVDTFEEAYLTLQQVGASELGNVNRPKWFDALLAESGEEIKASDVSVVEVTVTVAVRKPVDAPEGLPVVIDYSDASWSEVPLPMAKLYRASAGKMSKLALANASSQGNLYMLSVPRSILDKGYPGQRILVVSSYSNVESSTYCILDNVNREKLEDNRGIDEELSYFLVEEVR